LLPRGTYVHHLKPLSPELAHQEIEDASAFKAYRDLAGMRARGTGISWYVFAGPEIGIEPIAQLPEPIASRCCRPRFHLSPRSREPFVNEILWLEGHGVDSFHFF
jgi:hypothetical protein